MMMGTVGGDEAADGDAFAPTATGLPLSFGSAACSTDAKNASASRWTIIGDGG